MIPRSTLASAAAAAVLLLSGGVRAEGASPAPPKDAARFVGIGTTTVDPGEEAPPATLELATSTRGRVTWIGFNADLPLSARFSVVPRLELLRVGAIGEGSQSEWYPRLGGGLAFRPNPRVRVLASAWSGPTTAGLGTWGGDFSGSLLIGGDPDNDVPPPLELGAEVGATHFRWTEGNGPAGETLVQAWVSLSFALHPVAALTLEPEVSLFAYDKSFDPEPDETRLGAVGALARLGSYAPRAAYSLRVAYRLGAIVEPWVRGVRIIYAQDIGRAAEFVAGLRFHLPGDRGSIGVAGGLLNNQVYGSPLLDPEDDKRWVPVVLTEVALSF